MRPKTNPLGPILIAAILAVLFGVLYKFLGIGRTVYEYAIGALLLYGSAFLATMAVAALGFGVVFIVRFFLKRTR